MTTDDASEPKATWSRDIANSPHDVDVALENQGLSTFAQDQSAGSRGTDVVVACVVVTAIAAPFCGAAPTGTGWWDALLTAALAIIFVISASQAHRYVRIAAATAAAMFVGLSPWLVVAGLGLLCAIAADVRRDHETDLGALAGGLTFLGLLNLNNFGFFGSSALLSGAATCMVLASGYMRSPESVKSRVRAAVTGLGLILGAFLVVLAYTAVSVRASANAGVQSARQGLEAARAGDTQRLSVELERAEVQLAIANDKITSPVLKPLWLVPVAAQHLRSLSTATEQGLLVANDAVAASREANLDELQLRQGQFDLGLLAQMAPRLESAVANIEQTMFAVERDRSPWLVPQVDRQLRSLVDEAVAVLPEARTAAEAANVVPQLLGSDGERRYMMLFGSPGESREFGGFVGGYGLISVVDGGLDLLRAGSMNDLLALTRDGELDPAEYPDEYLGVDPITFPQNLTSTPNITLLAKAVRDVFPELEGAPIDGVIYADPFALAAMTEFTGPIEVDGLAEPLDRTGLIDFIFDGQYRVFDSRYERFGAIGALAAATAASFEGADLPGPERLGQVLGPAARAGRLQIVTYDDRENAFLESVRLQRHFFAPDEIDAFAIVQTNGTASKLDLFLQRTISYDVTVEDDGSLRATVQVELQSDMPADVPALALGETDGTNQVLLSLYSPHELTSLTVNGGDHRHVAHREFGFFRYALFKIALPPNETALVRFTLAGQAPEGDYQLGVWEQPLVNNDIVEVTYRRAGVPPIAARQELIETWLFAPAQAVLTTD